MQQANLKKQMFSGKIPQIFIDQAMHVVSQCWVIFETHDFGTTEG